MEQYHDLVKTPLGLLYCLIENDKILTLHPKLPASTDFATNQVPNSSHPLLQECKAQIDAYFSGRLRDFSLPLCIHAKTAFAQNALQTLLSIPFGETLSYSNFATLAQAPKAYRAIGTALSHNPLLLLLPCHRVIRSDSKIGGYAWGSKNKKWLLRFEGAI